jgi:hypothetical protein
LRALNNAADESLRLALWVKIDEKKRLSIDLPTQASQKQAGISFGQNE